MYQVGIVTLSDKGAKGERQDLSGPKIRELLPKDKYEVIHIRCFRMTGKRSAGS